MLVLLFALLGLLACVPCSVVAGFDNIQFSDIQQCGRLNVTFSQGKLPASLPLTLTVLPFNAYPISITLPNFTWDASTSTGVAITFLPLAAGTTFVASLDDADGNGVGLVSDIIKILPSDDDSCVVTPNVTKPEYTINTPLAQCQTFEVMFNSSTHASAPDIRAFFIRGPSYHLNRTEDTTDITVPPFQIAAYEMTAFRGVQVVMQLDDGNGYRELSNLTLIGGDVTSNTSCLSFFSTNTTAISNPQAKKGLSRNAIVAIAATIGSVVVAVALLMGIYAYRSRRKNPWSEIKGIEGGPGFEYPRGLPPIAPSPEPKAAATERVPPGGRLYSNPPYPADKFTASPLSPYFVQSPPSAEEQAQYASYPSILERGVSQVVRPSFVSITPPSLKSGAGQTQNNLQIPKSRQSISSVDIDQILDLATMYSPSHDSRVSKPLTPESPHTPYSSYSHIAITPMNMANRQHASFPISPMPSVSNFGDSRESNLQRIGPVSTIIERAWDEDHRTNARKSSGTYERSSPSFLAPERPAAAVTRHENGYLGVTSGGGVGRGGRGLP